MLTPLGAMRLAIDEAKRGLGFVAPNPPVGCVILSADGELIAQGYHKKFGEDHAEIDALKKVANIEMLKGATLYVTLEPCSHEGKTPSCAKKLATLPIKKVVYGLVDPNPMVAGRGLEILKQAKIETALMTELSDELEALAEHFLFNQRAKGPFVSLKVATSLDGQMAHSTGESKWITGERAREEAHFLRATHDAVLIGKGTFLRDDPGLDIRHPKFVGKKNKVIVVDSSGEVLASLLKSKLMAMHASEEIIVAVGPKLDEASAAHLLAERAGLQIWQCGTGRDGQVNLKSLLVIAFEKGVNSLLVEGGSRIVSAFLRENLAQRYHQFIAPQIIGAKSGLSVTHELDLGDWGSRLRLQNPQTAQLGEDILVTGRLAISGEKKI